MDEKNPTSDALALRTFLIEALGEVLEILAYTVVFDETAEAPEAVFQGISARIPFFGAKHGRITITLSHRMAIRLVQTLSGLKELDPARDRPLLEDAVKETANIVAGVFLRRVTRGPEEEYRLGLPKLVDTEERAGPEVESIGIAVTVEAEEGPISAELEMSLKGAGTSEKQERKP